MPPLAPPKGRSSRAHFQVISEASPRTSSRSVCGVIAQAALERPPGPVVLDPIAPKRQDGAVVGVDRHLHIDLAVGLGQQDLYVVFDVEQRCGLFDIGATDS